MLDCAVESSIGTSGLGAAVWIRTVSEAVAWTEIRSVGLSARGGVLLLRTYFSELTTAAASKFDPSWNFTPCLKVKSQVSGSTRFHDVARPGPRLPSTPTLTSGSITPAWVRYEASSVSSAQAAVGAKFHAHASF